MLFTPAQLCKTAGFHAFAIHISCIAMSCIRGAELAPKSHMHAHATLHRAASRIRTALYCFSPLCTACKPHFCMTMQVQNPVQNSPESAQKPSKSIFQKRRHIAIIFSCKIAPTNWASRLQNLLTAASGCKIQRLFTDNSPLRCTGLSRLVYLVLRL